MFMKLAVQRYLQCITNKVMSAIINAYVRYVEIPVLWIVKVKLVYIFNSIILSRKLSIDALDPILLVTSI